MEPTFSQSSFSWCWSCWVSILRWVSSLSPCHSPARVVIGQGFFCLRGQLGSSTPPLLTTRIGSGSPHACGMSMILLKIIHFNSCCKMGGLECVITGITDEFKKWFRQKKHRKEWFKVGVVLSSFLISIINITRVSGGGKVKGQGVSLHHPRHLPVLNSPARFLFYFQGGIYTYTFLDSYAAGISLLLAVLFEVLAVSWVYGKPKGLRLSDWSPSSGHNTDFQPNWTNFRRSRSTLSRCRSHAGFSTGYFLESLLEVY